MSDLRAVRVLDRVISKCNNVPPGVFTNGSKTSFVNNRPQIRLRDRSNPGPGPVITGSFTTFVDNLPAARVKDIVICGRITSGSSNTFIN